MDLYRTIQDLYAEKDKLERVIDSLEELHRTSGILPAMPAGAKKRGRKSMGQKERGEVALRMSLYWAHRRGDHSEQPDPNCSKCKAESAGGSGPGLPVAERPQSPMPAPVM